MLFFQKKVGETPLEMLDRVRIEMPELKDEKLSYAGRLDPMAHGEMLVLVGDENKNYKDYLGFDKEYIATFLIGAETDTGDILGLIKGLQQENFVDKKNIRKINDVKKIEESILVENLELFKKIKKQKYPWFSSKTIKGIKLFDYYKKGETDLERPERDVEVKEVEFLGTQEISSSDLSKQIFDSIQKVKGDFRQEEIAESWKKYFANVADQNIQIFKVKLKVSTGTYIRALTEEFNFPVTLLDLERTKIFT